MTRCPVVAAGWVALIAGLCAGCGGKADRSGQDGGLPADGDTRVELIYVHPDSQPAAAERRGPVEEGPGAGQRAGAEAAVPGQARDQAGGQAEAGGDDLIPYDPDGAFTVQVGVFQDPARARQAVRQLELLGYPVYAVAHPGTSGTRVRIGYFATRDQAERFGERFARDHGGPFWVDERGRERAAAP